MNYCNEIYNYKGMGRYIEISPNRIKCKTVLGTSIVSFLNVKDIEYITYRDNRDGRIKFKANIIMNNGTFNKLIKLNGHDGSVDEIKEKIERCFLIAKTIKYKASLNGQKDLSSIVITDEDINEYQEKELYDIIEAGNKELSNTFLSLIFSHSIFKKNKLLKKKEEKASVKKELNRGLYSISRYSGVHSLIKIQEVEEFFNNLWKLKKITHLYLDLIQLKNFENLPHNEILYRGWISMIFTYWQNLPIITILHALTDLRSDLNIPESKEFAFRLFFRGEYIKIDLRRKIRDVWIKPLNMYLENIVSKTLLEKAGLKIDIFLINTKK